MERLFWKKWHQLHEVFRVSLDSTVPAGEIPTFNLAVPDNLSEEMVYRAKKVESKFNPAIAAKLGLKAGGQETVDRHYHPRVGFENGKVSFKVHIVKVNPEDKMPFKRITLWNRAFERTDHASLKCGRASEVKAFGFEPNKPPYVTLAFPGLTGTFEPLFVRVSEYTGRELDNYFLKVTARDEPDNIVVVECSEVDAKEVPIFLKKA